MATPVRPLGRALLRRWSVERALEVGGTIKRADPASQRPPADGRWPSDCAGGEIGLMVRASTHPTVARGCLPKVRNSGSFASMDLSAIDDLQKFLKKEITPAVSDIEKLEDASRKHIQKLVYTNMVDRFDTMVDYCILANCREENLAEEALKNSTSPVTEAELIRLLMRGEKLQDALVERLQDGLRNSVLRQRHSRKLQSLIRTVAPASGADNPVPRVNSNTGSIVEKFKPQRKDIPHSIVGYADWLYSRRNSIVHGAGTNKFLENDKTQIKRLWKCDLSSTFKISVGSIRVALAFYNDLISILRTGA